MPLPQPWLLSAVTKPQANLQGRPTVPTFLNRAQLAERWNCSISTLKRREKSGELAPLRLGRRIVRFPMALIESIENQGAIGTMKENHEG